MSDKVDLQMIAAVFGADIMLDGRTTTVVAFNTTADEWVRLHKPLTESVAEFASLAIKAGLSVWAAIQTEDGVKFGPMTDKDGTPTGVAIN